LFRAFLYYTSHLPSTPTPSRLPCQLVNMVYSLGYRRPARVSRASSSRDSVNGIEKQKSIDESIKSSSSGMSHGIPEALSFDRIIAGGTCPVRSMSSAPAHPPTTADPRSPAPRATS